MVNNLIALSIAKKQYYVLNQQHQAVPCGVTEQLNIVGAGVYAGSVKRFFTDYTD